MLQDVINWIKAYIARSPDPMPSSFGPSKPKFLQSGKRYRVIREFADFDRGVHPVGEEWIFHSENFVPYHDGMSWFISDDGVSERHVRLQWIEQEQGDILSNLENYLVRVTDR